MKNKSLVSVIIPTYNRAKLLLRAINSVLNQTYNNLELLVVDDASTDKTKEIVKKMMEKDKRIKYIRHKKNRGGSTARNTGIKKSSGKYIALLDDDDEWLPKKIEKQVNKLNNLSSDWGGVYCHYYLKLPNEKIEKKINKEGNLMEDLLMLNLSVGSSILMFRKNCLINLGGFDESFQRHQDWELLIRFFKKYKLAVVKDILAIKYASSLPSATKIETTKKNYLTTFEKEINSLGTKKANKVISKHWFYQSKYFLKEFRIKKSLYYLQQSLKHYIYSLT